MRETIKGVPMPASALLESSSIYREKDYRLSAEIQEAAGRLACGEVVGMFNETVFAIVGNVNDPALAEKLQALKRDPSRSTVGLTVPFRDIVPMIDIESIADPKYRRLVADEGDELTGRIGGLAFGRFFAHKSLVNNPAVPQILVGSDPMSGKPTVQGWSPTGVERASGFIRAARAYQPKAGEYHVRPSMTSMNLGGKPEIVDMGEALEFIENAPVNIRPMMLDLGKYPEPGAKPIGSYPIVTVRTDKSGQTRLERTREGNLSGEILQLLLDGYEIDLYPEDFKPSAYPENVFTVNDLPERYRHLRGGLMRLALLETFGWQSDAGILLDEALET
jgi:hypothetical protein